MYIFISKRPDLKWVWLFKLICCSVITLLIDRSAEINSNFMFFNTFLNACDYSANSRQKSALKLTRRKQVGGNSLEHTVLECNCPLCKALHFSEEHFVMWRETAFFFSQRAFLLIFILLVHLFVDPTVQSDIQLLQFPQTKTCFEWLLQMRSLKIKQLCSNCFSSTHLFFPCCCCFVYPSLWKERKQAWKQCTLTYLPPSSSCHSHGRLMILI